MTMQTRMLAAAECRFENDTSTGTVKGYALVFGEVSPTYNETLRRGAFSRTLAEHRAAGTRPAMLWAHDQREPIGVWTDLVEDERGLKVIGKLATETTRGRDVFHLLDVGAVTGLSIGFTVRAFERNADGVRVLTDVDLGEVSLVPWPAYKRARVTSVRAAEMSSFSEAVRRAVHALSKGS